MGSLHIITGPMFSGKSSTLIARSEQEGRGTSLCFNHKLDVRYSKGNKIVTHDFVSVHCDALNTIDDARAHPRYHEASHIFIDEVQFFTNIRDTVLRMVEVDGKHVYLAGLLVDTNRNLFGELYTIMGLADTVEFRSASRCALCDRVGLFSQSRNPAKTIVDVGQSDKYIVLCRCHYLNNKINK